MTNLQKNISYGFAVLMITLLITMITYVGPGYRGVCINLFAKQDIQDTSLSTGLHFLAPWKKVWKFPTFEQNVSWEKREAFRFQTCEGLASSADIGITFALDPDAVPILFRKYRSGINEISQKFVKNYLRDAITVAASSRGIEDLYGKGKEQFLLDIQEAIQGRLSHLGILVSRVYLVDAFIFPESVVNALNRKIEAAQRAEQRENELREAEAEARKQIAEAHGQSESIKELANASAQANTIINESLTTDLLFYEAIKAWDCKTPKTMTCDPITMFKNIN